MASAYHSSKWAPGVVAAFFRERRRRAARAFFPRVGQVLRGALSAPPGEAVAVQQLVDPRGAERQVQALLQIGRQAGTRPAREDEAQLPGVGVRRLQQHLQRGGTDARRPTGTRRVRQPLQAPAAPALTTAVHRAHRDAQGASNTRGTLSLGAPQDDGRAQALPGVLLSLQGTPEASALGGRQPQALVLGTHIAAPSHSLRPAAMLPPDSTYSNWLSAAGEVAEADRRIWSRRRQHFGVRYPSRGPQLGG